jgi:hypothetical protein
MNPKARRICVIAMAFAALLSFGANADVIQLTGVTPGSVEAVSIVGSDASLGGPSYTGGVYTGLYAATVNGSGTWLTYCIDPIGEINIGTSWNANLLTGSDLANNQGVLYTKAYTIDEDGTVLSDKDTAQKYALISYIAENYYYDQSESDNLGVAGRSALSLAFWEISRDYDGIGESLNLGDGRFIATGGNCGLAAKALEEAFGHVGDKITMTVWSPVERPSQEFIAIQVPEPSTFSLLLLGMGCMAGFWGFRRKK